MTTPWMDTAKELIGTKETPGPKSNKVILDWAKEIDEDYSSDSIPWCGLFIAYCYSVNNIDIDPIDSPLWALSWKKFGLRLRTPTYGALLVFKRASGGHVGFYVSEDKDYYHVLGGNQSNGVNIKKVAKWKCVSYGIRWPKEFESTLEIKQVFSDLDEEELNNQSMA